MKILLVYADLFPNYPNWSGHFYSGIGLLSAVLRAAGHETSLLHVTRKFACMDDFLARVREHNPGLIAFSSTTLTFKYVREMAVSLDDARFGTPVISGGIHTTLLPKEVITAPGIDMACVGEGEISLLNLVEAMSGNRDYRTIQGIWVKDGGTILENGVSPIVRDLNTLPFPDRSVFDYPHLEHEKGGKAVFMASRGCPYHCTYCSNRILQETLCPGAPGAYVRFRTVDNLLAEIGETLASYPFIDSLHFDDDLFFLARKWAEEFTENYPRQVGLPFTCNMRPNHLSDEIARLLRDAGCVEVKIGLESGNGWIRNKVLRRNLSDAQMYNAFRVCHEAGLRVHTFNMVGLPFETTATVLDTIKMNALGKADFMQVSVFYPLPKTELDEICIQQGFCRDEKAYDYFESMLEIGTLSRKRISYFLKNFRLLVILYAKALCLKRSLSPLAVSALDMIMESMWFDAMGRLLSIVRKVRSLLRGIRGSLVDAGTDG